MEISSTTGFIGKFKEDPARANRFTVNIPGYNVDYLCHVSQLPGKTFATTEQKTYGPIEKYPYLVTYNDIDLTFYVDGKMDIKKKFDQWFETINSVSNNDFEYKKNYCKDITINQYNMRNELIYAVKCLEAYPISMNQLDLDWSSESFHNLTVTFAYTYWMQLNANILNMTRTK